MLPEPTARLRFRAMRTSDLDDVTALLSAFDPVRPGQRRRARDCGLTVQDVEGVPHVEVGYHVMPDLRRRGHATEAARSVRDCAAAHGVEHLVALIRPDNTPSQGVARNLGMVLERTAHVHGADALVFGTRLAQP